MPASNASKAFKLQNASKAATQFYKLDNRPVAVRLRYRNV